uniref:Reverse transcriptase domain-containing protein n=1 Tax=Heliothis virescens TaxID=7102 RepID=A0A2A4JBK9_HELVI
MYTCLKYKNIMQEMKRLNIDILGISESRLKGTGIEVSDDTLTYYSGNNDSEHSNGVAIMIKKHLKSSVINFYPVSDRVMLLQLKAQPVNINIVQVYAPTGSKTHDSLIDPFYEEIRQVLSKLRAHECNIVMGDFNAKIGEGVVNGIVGGFGLGDRNDRGDRLVQFCQEHNFVVTNTFFKLPPRRLYTWTSPAHTPEHIVRNQIDFILVNQRFKNSIKSAKTYPGADINSDHNPIIATMSIKLKKLIAPAKRPRIDVTKLRHEDARLKLHAALNHKVNELQQQEMNLPMEPKRTWDNFKTVMVNTATEVLSGIQIMKKKEDWMTDDIFMLIKERRELKNVDIQKYKAVHKEIVNRCKDAKDKWANDQCQEIEKLQEKHDYFNMYKKIKEITGKKRSNVSLTLLDEDGNVAMSIEEKLKTWERYVKQLFSDTRSHQVLMNNKENVGPEITKAEVIHAIKSSKSGKSVGPDEIPSEILKLLTEENLSIIVRLFNDIYNTGVIPEDWLHSTFVTLPKTNNAKKCNAYRTISLMSHVLKVFLKIIHNRIYKMVEENISNTQFGFRNGFGTRDALFGYQVLLQRCWDMNQSVYVCFIDYEKAFDRVQHDKLINILRDIGLDHSDLTIIKNLYWHQKARVRVDQVLTDDIDIERGVRQGCILSPLLFNIYAEAIFAEALEDTDGGVVVNGLPINNLRYADDTILLASGFEDLQGLLRRVDNISANYGLSINLIKTKVMIVGKSLSSPIPDLVVRNQTVQRVHSNKYLGCIVNDQNNHSVEIKCRIEQARSAFMKLSHMLCNRSLKISTRVRLARCYVFSVLLYGVEAWTLTENMCKRLEAFEMWVYRRILRISWTDRISNVKVLQMVNKKAEVLNTVKRRKLQYLGHIMRNDKYILLQLIMQGKIQGRRTPGRRRTSWLKNLRTWFNLSTRSLFRAAVSKVKIALMIADLR